MRPKSRPNRRAYLLIETAMAGLMIALGMAMTLKLLGWTIHERRSSERRGWAAQEAANVMERVAALPFSRLTTEAARAEAKLSPGAVTMLPDARIKAEVHDEPPLKRIVVVVTWKGTAGLDDRPTRLTSWVARKAKESPQ